VLGALDARTISRLRKALRYPNPEYIKARMSGEEPDDLPVYLTACEELPDGGVCMPRGAIGAVRSTLHLRRVKPDWTDERSYGEPLDVELHGITPRDYQEEGASLLRQNVQGLVVLPCGGGKTYLGITAIAKLKRSTLVIVPTRDLVDQWTTDVRAVFQIEPSIFGAGKQQLGPLTIATADALIYHSDTDLSRFGFALYDEAHRVPAPTRRRLMGRLPARFRLGLTATPDREDGQSKIVKWMFGDVLLEKSVAELVEAGFLKLPRLEGIDTSFTYDFPNEPHWKDFSRLNKALIKDRGRNQIIADLVRREPNETWLVLSPSSKDHAKAIAAYLRRKGVDALDVTGDTSAGKRKKIMQSFRDNKLRVLAATSLADEGFNVKHLNRVILALPEGAKGRTAQRLGRIMRPDGGDLIVYDLIDRNVDILVSRWNKRKTVYRKLGLEIRECPTLGLFHPATA
jgi:superfamily II DNA or RNA helicase